MIRTIDLIEPEVWIEYLRVHESIYVSGANYIIPKGIKTRNRQDEKTGETIWEYLV